MSFDVSSPIAFERLRVVIRGAVQGIGFRPFTHRLAANLHLAGWVSNGNDGVTLEVEGPHIALKQFLVRLASEMPALAIVQSLEPTFLDPVGFDGFSIRESSGGEKTALVMPDIATCAECLQEIFHPDNRRYQYPFTNCTHCGPRYSVMEDLPYDRAKTTMKFFEMCPDCQWEYNNPRDRRFHAQPIACPACGPQLSLWDRKGKTLARRHEALVSAVQGLREGLVVAVKGLGGFHLCVDAGNERAVQTLRQRKHRQEKPFALMVPSLAAAQSLCEVSALEERLLTSAESPIVLLRRKPGMLAPSVAPGNPNLGIMLPYTPLHHVILKEFPFPLVATSGNHSEEPICTDEREALADLNDLADLFLVHDRPIARPVDDSVVAVLEGRELVLRRSRGYAPLPIVLRHGLPKTLAVGAHLKNTVAAAIDNQAFVSQHIGDLETASAFVAFKEAIRSFEHFYEFSPEVVVSDLHPNYMSTHYANSRESLRLDVQHHYAHVLSCMADNDLEGPVLGVVWDGTGYGIDHTIWGGEYLHVTAKGFERAAHLRTFRLPGHDKAVREPRRSALGLLYAIFGDCVFERRNSPSLRTFEEPELILLQQMLAKGIQAPLTSSMGRLFDAVASLLDLRQQTTYEGQAATALEFAAARHPTEECYPVDGTNWEPMIRSLLDDRRAQVPVDLMAAKFHNTLVEMILLVARQVNESKVVLTGGCFQNRLLASRAIRRLRQEGFQPYWHQRIPPNDGGIALGQIMAVARQFAAKGKDHVLSGSR